MRWKLVLIVSLVASVAGVGSTIGIVYAMTRSVAVSPKPSVPAFAALLLPLAAIIFAAFFVYRHTARRRRLQAMLTALLALILTFTSLLFANAFYTKPAETPVPAPHGIGELQQPSPNLSSPNNLIIIG